MSFPVMKRRPDRISFIDEALEAQRQAHIDRLTRRASRVGAWVWVTLAFVIVALALLIAAYLTDRHRFPFLPAFMSVISLITALTTDARHRRQAAWELDRLLNP